MQQCVVDPFRVQAKLWPARQFGVLRQAVHPLGDIEDAALETRQPRPLDGRLDRTVEDLGLGAG